MPKVTLKSGKVFEAKYVVACDGASSVVARTLNSEGRETKKKEPTHLSRRKR